MSRSVDAVSLVRRLVFPSYRDVSRPRPLDLLLCSTKTVSPHCLTKVLYPGRPSALPTSALLRTPGAPMPDHSESIEVAAAPATVYALITDLPRMGEWSPECTRVTWR